MKLIIDIPENLYKATVNGLDANEIWNLRLAVKNGTPLPKGHGRLIDADKLKEQDFGDNYYTIKAEIDRAETIIEADKEN